jgi:hypothetical protein
VLNIEDIRLRMYKFFNAGIFKTPLNSLRDVLNFSYGGC